MALLSFLLFLPSIWLVNVRWGLGSTNGVVVGKDGVFVASGARVYKFGLDGEMIKWVITPGAPIHITSADEHVIVHHGGESSPIGEAGFRVIDPGDMTATVERSWWGHPMLKVRDGTGVRVSSMQPWYLTLVQTPYPGVAWMLPATLLAWLAERICPQKRLPSGS